MIVKSQVQKMFPTIGHGGWWQAFFLYSICIAFLVPLLSGFISFLKGCEIEELGEHIFLVWGLWLLFSFIIGYFLANRSERNFFFDVTRDAIVFRSPESFGFLRTVPFSVIGNVVVRPGGGDRRIVEIRSNTWGSAKYPLCRLYYFDEKTAFALKEYILEKMRDAKKSGE